MKKYLFCLFLLLAGVVHADELSDANKLLEARDFPAALQIYTRLAAGGNAQAQLHLGDMHWSGAGTAVDMASAEAWYRKAAAAGNAEAIETMKMLAQRQLRSADLAYWSAGYDGADLAAGKFACVRPVIPALSTSNDEIKRVSELLDAWEACYNGFVANLNDALPPGKRIPADIARLMNPAEAIQAAKHLDQVYGRVGSAAQAGALAIVAERDAWRKATQDYVVEANRLASDRTRVVKAQLENQRQREINFESGKVYPSAAVGAPGGR